MLDTTDNGPHLNEWPDAAITPFRREKNTNWEGGYRVPAFVRWPGKIAPGSVSNEIASHLDWVPTLTEADGITDVAVKLKRGFTAKGKKYKVHLDGYNLLRILMIFDLRMDPYERAELHYNVYNHWHTKHQFLALAGLPIVTNFVKTFEEFPARQIPGSYNVERITALIQTSAAGKK